MRRLSHEKDPENIATGADGSTAPTGAAAPSTGEKRAGKKLGDTGKKRTSAGAGK